MYRPKFYFHQWKLGNVSIEGNRTVLTILFFICIYMLCSSSECFWFWIECMLKRRRQLCAPVLRYEQIWRERENNREKKRPRRRQRITKTALLTEAVVKNLSTFMKAAESHKCRSHVTLYYSLCSKTKKERKKNIT